MPSGAVASWLEKAGKKKTTFFFGAVDAPLTFTTTLSLSQQPSQFHNNPLTYTTTRMRPSDRWMCGGIVKIKSKVFPTVLAGGLERGSTTEASRRHQARNHLAAMAAIDAEVGICSENHRLGKRFGHAHQARVGEAHGQVCVLSQELEHWLDPAVQVEGLGQDGLAGAPGWRISGCLSHWLLVVGIAEQKARVNEDVSGHSPWFSDIASSVRSSRQVSRRPIR